VAEPSTPTAPENFHRDYFPLRNDDAPSVILPVNAKYPLPIKSVPNVVNQYKDMLDKVANLKFMDHDIIDTQKFLELAKD
jgi:hypothetical protein